MTAKQAMNASDYAFCRLEALLSKYTAFDTLDALKRATAKGWAPSIHAARGRAKREKAELVALLRDRGYRVYDGVRVA